MKKEYKILLKEKQNIYICKVTYTKQNKLTNPLK